MILSQRITIADTLKERSNTMAEYIDREKLLRDIDHYHVSDGKFQHWSGRWNYCPNCGAKMDEQDGE